MSLEILKDLNRTSQLDAAARKQLAIDLASHLGAGWDADDEQEGHGLFLRHTATELTFVAIPGGTFEMGFTETDEDVITRDFADAPDLDQTIEELARVARPARTVTIAPFLMTRGLLRAEQIEALSRGAHAGPYAYTLARADARALASDLGFRLCSEAELQWVAREGGTTTFVLDAADKVDEVEGDSEAIPSRFALLDLFTQQWAEDDFHPSFDGAPSDGRPWMDGDPHGVSTNWTEPELVEEHDQKLALLACLRSTPGDYKAQVRLAYDLTL